MSSVHSAFAQFLNRALFSGQRMIMFSVRFLGSTAAWLTAMLCIGSAGCVLQVHGHRDVQVTVLDAETEQPIPFATVTVHYEGTDADPFALSPFEAKTDSSGTAWMRVARNRGYSWDVFAANYAVPSDTCHFLSASDTALNRSETIGQHVVLRIYRKPNFTVVIVVPDGYRGPVLIERVPSDRSLAPGQRQIVCTARADGRVTIEDTEPLRSFGAFVTLREASGRSYTPSERHSPCDDSTRFDWVWGEGQWDLYIVGTHADRQSLWGKINKQGFSAWLREYNRHD